MTERIEPMPLTDDELERISGGSGSAWNGTSGGSAGGYDKYSDAERYMNGPWD